jgi:hypothetical protein
MNYLNRLLVSAVLYSGTFGLSSAADLTRDAADFSDDSPAFADEWVISTTPYFWATFYDGTMTVDGQTVDLTGTNIFDLLDAGEINIPPLVNYFEARKGNWGVYLDTTLIGLNFGDDFSLGPGPGTAAVSLDFTYALINAGVIYTPVEWVMDNGTVAWDVMGGVRYTYYNLDLDVTVPIGSGNFESTVDWWDATLGTRLRGDYENGWNWVLLADIAGADFESDFSAQAVANFGRDFSLGSMDMSWLVGYRFLYQDWSDGDDAVDLITHGPIVGLRFHF